MTKQQDLKFNLYFFGALSLIAVFVVLAYAIGGITIGLLVLMTTPILAFLILMLICNSSKPNDKKIIKMLCQRFNVEPNQILMVNDNAIITLDNGKELNVTISPLKRTAVVDGRKIKLINR